MGPNNPDPESYKAPWSQTMRLRLDRAEKWITAAEESFDPDFPDPSIADLSRARAMFAKLVQDIDEIILEDASGECIPYEINAVIEVPEDPDDEITKITEMQKELVLDEDGNSRDACPTCGGEGEMCTEQQVTVGCETCNGKGKV